MRGVLRVVLSAALGGVKGLVGALLGVGLVIFFFGISAVAMTWASRKSPQVMMMTRLIAPTKNTWRTVSRR